MIAHIIYIVVTFAAGFGVGRIKNKAKLAAATAELNKLKAWNANVISEVTSGVGNVVAEVKSKV